MAQRTCDTEGCERTHVARGLCAMHWKRAYGRKTKYPITCITCGETHLSIRRDGKFCSDLCKGLWYSDTRRTKCPLPNHHPVMVLIAESRRPKPKPAKVDMRVARECPSCGCWFSPLSHAAATQMVCCTYRCKRRMTARRRRAREHNTLNAWRWSDFMRVARKFDYRCAYCGTKAGQLEPDHVVPLSKGGPDAVSNLLPACSQCNGDKRDLLLDEWALDREARGKPPRATNWPAEDRRYWHLTSVSAAA